MQRLNGTIESRTAGATNAPLFLINTDFTGGKSSVTSKTISKICSVNGCNIIHRALGLCNIHYRRWRRHGHIETVHRSRCSVTKCAGRHFSLGLCQKHYNRQRTYGNPITTLVNVGVGNTPEERFWSRVDTTPGYGPNGDCWEWQGAVKSQKRPYGTVYFASRSWLTHRLAWFLTNDGDLPKMVRHFVCDNPRCCNPAHLLGGTHADNMRDMVRHGRQFRRGVR